MSAAWFVGRVGGLAVALGVGAAVTLGAPAAWADDSDGSDGSSSTTATGAEESTESQDSTTNTGTPTGAGSGGSSAPGSGSANGTASGATGSRGSVVRQALPGIVRASGGAQSSVTAQRLRAAVDDVVEAFSTGERPTIPSHGTARGGTNRQQRPTEDADTLAMTRDVRPPRPQAPTLRHIVDDYANTTRTTNGTAAVHTPTFTNTRLTTFSAAPTEQIEHVPTVSTVVLRALAASGLGPLAGDDPVTPVDSPLGLALLAIGARSRQSESSSNTQSFDNSETFTALTAAAASTAPPRFVSKPPIPVGNNPAGAVISSDGRMFVANTGSATVSVINTATGQRIDANPNFFSTDISVGSSPSALALSPDGKRLYVANTGSGTVSVIDTASYKRIDANPSFFSQDISVGASPSALAMGADGRLYVANRGSNTVSVINTANNSLVDVNTNTSGIQSISAGTAPTALTLGADGRLYVVNQGNGTVSVINTATYGVTNTIIVGSQPSSAALGLDGRLYVTNSGAGTVSVINTATSTVIDTNPDVAGTNPITVGPSPSSVAFSPDGKFAYVANGNDTVSVIDTATYAVVSTVAVDTDTTGGHVVAVSPNGTVYVTDASDNTVRVLAVRFGNSTPVAGTPTVGSPNSAGKGAVTGALNFTDPDGDTLSYSVTQPSSGTVSIASNGTYTFTPSLAARQAAATGGPTSTTFIVKATDGEAVASVNVTVPIAVPTPATGINIIGANATVTGYPYSEVFTPDGTRAVIVTTAYGGHAGNTRVAIVDTSTGKQIGSTAYLNGDPVGPALLNTDGSRAVITSLGEGTVRVMVIDTRTGAQVGTTVGFPTYMVNPTILSANGTRAVITATSYGLANGGTRVAIIDTTSGEQVGSTLMFPGYQSSMYGGGSSAVLTTIDGSSDTGFTTRVAVIDTVTGTLTGTPVEITGAVAEAPVFNATGTRAVITTDAAVMVLDTTTAAQVGPTRNLTGRAYSTLATADGKRVLVTTRIEATATEPAATTLTLIDISTGAQLGTTLTLDGQAGWDPPVMANPTRALVTTYETDGYDIVKTHITVVDTTNGTKSATFAFAGRIQGKPLLNANGTHAMIASADGTAVIIDIATATQTGPSVTLAGQPRDFQVVGAGNALITTNVPNPYVGTGNSQVKLINMRTGAQIGTTLALAGDVWHVQLSGDGTRALVVSHVENLNVVFSDPDSTRVAVIDTTTGKQVGTTITLSGELYGAQLLSAGGTHVLLTTELWDPVLYRATTRLVVINTTTGRQVGSPVNITGQPSPPAIFSADGSRVLITTAAVTYAETRVAVLRVT